MPRAESITIGVISDTHGLLRPEALLALRGVDRILHAGDIGGPEILEALEQLAPVTSVLGNNDTGAWARALPDTSTPPTRTTVVKRHGRPPAETTARERVTSGGRHAWGAVDRRAARACADEAERRHHAAIAAAPKNLS